MLYPLDGQVFTWGYTMKLLLAAFSFWDWVMGGAAGNNSGVD